MMMTVSHTKSVIRNSSILAVIYVSIVVRRASATIPLNPRHHHPSCIQCQDTYRFITPAPDSLSSCNLSSQSLHYSSAQYQEWNSSSFNIPQPSLSIRTAAAHQSPTIWPNMIPFLPTLPSPSHHQPFLILLLPPT